MAGCLVEGKISPNGSEVMVGAYKLMVWSWSDGEFKEQITGECAFAVLSRELHDEGQKYGEGGQLGSRFAVDCSQCGKTFMVVIKQISTQKG